MDNTKSVRLQGILEKRGKFTGALNTRKYRCTLQDGLFTYHKDGDKAKILNIVQFQSIRPVRECSFEIITHSTMHVFTASCATERDNWVSAMQELMWHSSRKHSLPNFKSIRRSSEDKAIYDLVKDTSKLNTTEKSRSMKRPIDICPSAGYESIPFSLPSHHSVTRTSESECKNVVTYEEIDIQNDNILKTKIHPFTYEEVGVAMENYADCSNSSKPYQSPKDESSNGTDLYAYATADDIRKVLIRDTPKLCNEYSSVLDSRNSAFLYSEVASGDDDKKSGGKGSESVSSRRPKNPSRSDPIGTETGIYHLITEPDMDVYSTVSRMESECYHSVNNRFQEAVGILESAETLRGYDECSSDNSTVRHTGSVHEKKASALECVDCNRIHGVCSCGNNSRTFENITYFSNSGVLYDKLGDPKEIPCNSATADVDAHKSTDIGLVQSELLNISGQSVADTSIHLVNDTSDNRQHHSAFHELRTYMGMIGSNEQTEVLSGNTIRGDSSAISDLRRFLNQLE